MLYKSSECFIILNMRKANPTIIRLSLTSEVRRALSIAKERYPALSDPEILKLGLSKIATETTHQETINSQKELNEIRYGAAYAVGHDYLKDETDDIYTNTTGKRVRFS